MFTESCRALRRLVPIGVLAVSASSAPAASFDAFNDFQTSSNVATNTWSYWSDGTTDLTNYNSMINLMDVPFTGTCGFGTSCWFSSVDNSVILQNATGSVAPFGDGGDAPSGLLTYYPRLSTVVVRFDAPSNGHYTISADFSTLSANPSPTEFAVVLNGTSFLASSTALGSFPFSDALNLSAGETLDFIVAGGDCSAIGCNNSATSFDASIRPTTGVPEPATWMLFGFGMAGLALARTICGRARPISLRGRTAQRASPASLD